MQSIAEIRAQFPALLGAADVFLDNAGGSQVPAVVADAIRDYMLSTYVQLGADYATSRYSTAVVDQAHDLVRLFMNGTDIGEVALASSTTALCNMLAGAHGEAGPALRNEIIIAETAHEANAGAWYRLQDRGFIVKTWPVEPDTLELNLDALHGLLSDRTRIVAFPHVSNLLGRIEDAGAITRMAHDAGARVVIDGVAFAPHRAIDVAALKADWYVYSTYKVFGPHMAALFGTDDAFSEVEGPNHFFIPRDEIPYKFEPGGPSHEGCAGLLALWPYLASLAGEGVETEPHRHGIVRAFDRITEMETELQQPLIAFLTSRPGIRLIGPSDAGTDRVPTVSFVHETKRSADIAKAANEQGYGIRFGHFYASRLCERLVREGLLHDPEDGVVRVSMLHYNTMKEVDRLIACLEGLL